MRFLMCPPYFYNTHFLFNPWMSYKEDVDSQKALTQWENLKNSIEKAGGEVEVIEPDPREGAMVFVRDNAFVYDKNKVLIIRSYGPRGKREPKILEKFFKKRKWKVTVLPKNLFLEGGNLIWLNENTILAGFGSDIYFKAYEWFVEFLKKERKKDINLILVKLIDKKYLHLDMVLSCVQEKIFLVYKRGLNLGKNWKNSFLWQGLPILELEDSETYGANLISVNNTVIGSCFSNKTIEKLKSFNFNVENLDLSEFHKAGGGAHCLTLNLEPEF